MILVWRGRLLGALHNPGLQPDKDKSFLSNNHGSSFFYIIILKSTA